LRIALLSCFYPFRGGISQFNASLYLELGKSHTVKAFNFKRQYPEFLFPGKTQYVTKDDDAVPIESEALLDTANPFTYRRTYKAIRDWKPDLVIISYWMSYFGPSLGYVARRLRKRCKVISVLHNVIPHEPKFFDAPLTKYFLSGCTGNVTLCDEVAEDLHRLSPKALNATIFHPIYEHFGEKLPRGEAEKALGLTPGKRNLLFFGLIREYKGLDILLEAFAGLDDSYQLIIAGEPYGSFDKYQRLIDSSPAKDRIRLFTHYIKDSEVKDYFSAADLAVLPYRSATQSGITSSEIGPTGLSASHLTQFVPRLIVISSKLYFPIILQIFKFHFLPSRSSCQKSQVGIFIKSGIILTPASDFHRTDFEDSKKQLNLR
jgi:glycosyltransferase involved in cell wall biosynthesis